MTDFTLYIGNKTYSSWSLRGWLAMKVVGAPFEEVVIPLSGPGQVTTEILAHSPSGRVPALRHKDLVVWDSLAIAEYLAEIFPRAGLLPEDVNARATCRSVSAEMHSSFAPLRSAMPMNVRREPAPIKYAADVAADVARIVAIWKDCLTRFGKGGPYLFGRFSLADAMYAPVATRFHHYGVTMDVTTRGYVDAIYAHPAMRTWVEEAKKEPWVVEGYEKLGK
jgi:glutathione S-transferase